MRFPTIRKAPDQPAHMHSLIRAFASRLNILWVLSYWLNIVWSLWALKEAAQARLSLHSSECHTKSQLNLWHISFEPMCTIRCVLSYRKIQTSTTNLVFHASSAPFILELFVIGFFFMQTHEKETQLGNYVLCTKSVFVRQYSHRVLPES